MRARTCKVGDLAERYPSLAVSGYQRAVVWSYPQRAALIRSLLEDYPTGLLVLNNLTAPKKRSRSKAFDPYRSRIEIIDGQQRLTTIFDFFQEPLLYFTTWAPHLPHRIEEPRAISVVRERYDALIRELRTVRAAYVPAGTTKKNLANRVSTQANVELQRRLEGKAVGDPRFHELIVALASLRSAIARRYLVIEELDGLDSADAESIYDVINSSGTRLRWWELLWGREEFVHTPYPSTEPYRTTRVEDVERAGIFRRMRNIPRSSPIRAVPAEVTSLWHAMHALGQYCHHTFSLRDPRINPQIPEGSVTKPRVDGLGFRLVSTFLSHDISRAAIYDLIRDYPVDQIRETIDILFDTVDVVFDPKAAGDYQFFTKYASVNFDPLQAYPLLGLFIAASKFVASNRSNKEGIRLSTKDTAALRALTEEMFRDAICTTNWAGTGDARLKEWLDSHFEPVTSLTGRQGSRFPGTVRPIPESPKMGQWRTHLAGLAETKKRTPDRRTAAFHFWVQYLVDSTRRGALPRGDARFDHVVPFNKNYPLTTHPLNVACISGELNSSKGNYTYAGWNPAPEIDRRYREQVVCQPNIPDIPAGANADFLVHANFTDLRDMIEERRKVFDFVLASFMPKWVSEGDATRPK